MIPDVMFIIVENEDHVIYLSVCCGARTSYRLCQLGVCVCAWKVGGFAMRCVGHLGGVGWKESRPKVALCSP